jgi:hypothetical protein
MQNTASELERILDEARPRLLALDEMAAGERPVAEKWSRKEILGHLIDSAANNHQRFVRLQIEPTLTLPGYRQPDWVRLQQYQDRSWSDLVDLWIAYNRHLAHVMRHADPQAAGNIWKSPDGDVTLAFLMTDYLKHLRHHLDQIL